MRVTYPCLWVLLTQTRWGERVRRRKRANGGHKKEYTFTCQPVR
jgi:hypothetical protein